MVQTYLRYSQQQLFGCVVSAHKGGVWDAQRCIAVTPALEAVRLTDVRTGTAPRLSPGEPQEALMLLLPQHQDPQSHVTAIQANPKSSGAAGSLIVAAGYSDGRIRIWDLGSGECLSTFHGHRTAVLSLRYSRDASYLASGGADNRLIVWDPVSERGICSLRGHKGPVTDVCWLEGEQRQFLISASADALIKVWDLSTQHCIQTLVGHRSEVWSIDVNPEQTRLVSGSADSRIRVWKVDPNRRPVSHRHSSDPSSSLAQVGDSGETAGEDGSGEENQEGSSMVVAVGMDEVVEYYGELPRQIKKRVSVLRFNQEGTLLACSSSGSKQLELFIVSSPELIQKKVRRRQRRRRAKTSQRKQAKSRRSVGEGETADGFPTEEEILPTDEYHVVDSYVGRHEISGFAFSSTPEPGRRSKTRGSILLMLQDNRVRTLEYSIPSAEDKVECSKTHEVAVAGHRAAIRSVAFSWDNLQLATAGADGLKIWNSSNSACLATLKGGGFALSCVWLPDNEHIVVGTKAGHVELWHVPSRSLLFTSRKDNDGDDDDDDEEEKDRMQGGEDDATGRSEQGKEKEEVAPHSGPVWSVELSPEDWSTVWSAGGQTIVQWNIKLIRSRKRRVLSSEAEEESKQKSNRKQQQQSKRKSKKKQKRGKKKVSSSDAEEMDAELDIPENEEETPGYIAPNQLTLTVLRDHDLQEEVLCLKCSPDGRYILVGLMDSTAKVLHADTLRFFLSLYGHRLPILSIDVSSDSTLVATASADKSIKIWGLDFGDCHTSFRAHEQPVTQVRWVPHTHYLFSTGRDGLVKHWDGDRFEQIQVLRGHQSEVWALGVSHRGAFDPSTQERSSGGELIATAGSDMGIRIWERTEEMLFLEEEQEMELERKFDEGVMLPGGAGSGQVGQIEGLGLPGAAESQLVAGPSAMSTSQSQLKAGERIMEALDVCTEEEERWQGYFDTHWKRLHSAAGGAERGNEEEESAALRKARQVFGAKDTAAGVEDDGMQVDEESSGAETGKEKLTEAVVAEKPPPNILFRGQNLWGYLYEVLLSVRAAELDAALMLLPFGYAVRLLKFLAVFLEEGWGDQELCIRAALLLLQVHERQLRSMRSIPDVVLRLRTVIPVRIRAMRDTLGTNIAALQWTQMQIKQEQVRF